MLPSFQKVYKFPDGFHFNDPTKIECQRPPDKQKYLMIDDELIKRRYPSRENNLMIWGDTKTLNSSS